MSRKETRTTSRGSSELTYLTTLCATTGAVMCVPVTTANARRYTELHALIPADLEQWPEEALDELLEELDTPDVEVWQRVLILLAHHRSERAARLLEELSVSLPEDLTEFGEMAYAESLGWLGMDYLRQFGWTTPHITRHADLEQS